MWVFEFCMMTKTREGVKVLFGSYSTKWEAPQASSNAGKVLSLKRQQAISSPLTSWEILTTCRKGGKTLRHPELACGSTEEVAAQTIATPLGVLGSFHSSARIMPIIYYMAQSHIIIRIVLICTGADKVCSRQRKKSYIRISIKPFSCKIIPHVSFYVIPPFFGHILLHVKSSQVHFSLINHGCHLSFIQGFFSHKAYLWKFSNAVQQNGHTVPVVRILLWSFQSSPKFSSTLYWYALQFSSCKSNWVPFYGIGHVPPPIIPPPFTAV